MADGRGRGARWRRSGAAAADNITASYDEDGKFFTDDGVPTFKVAEDGTVDWYTFSGFRRYHSECHVCHGPDGEGSTYAPALAKSVMRHGLLRLRRRGRERRERTRNNVMPSLRDQPERHVLPRRHLHLPARPSAPRRSRAAGRRSARRSRQASPRRRMPAWADAARAARRWRWRWRRGPAAAQLTDLVVAHRLPGLRRPGEPAVLERGRRGVREQDRRAFRRASSAARSQYTWFRWRRASCADAAVENNCDVIMGYAQGDELVLNTNHYYTSTHVLVIPQGQRPRGRDHPGRPAAQGSPHRGDRRHAAGDASGAQRADARRWSAII